MIGEEAIDEKSFFKGAAFSEREFGGDLDGFDGRLRRFQAAGFFGSLFAGGGEDGDVFRGVAQFFVALARFGRGFGGDFLREGDGAGEKVSVDQFVHDAGFESIAGRDGIAGGTHFEGFDDAGEAREALRAAGAGDNAKFYFGLADLGAGNGNAVVAGHGEFQSAAEGRAVDGDDDGFPAVFDFQQDRQQACAARLSSAGEFAEFFNVRAGHEGAAAADQDRGFHRVIFVDLVDGVGDAFGYSGAQGVYRRVVDGDDGDVVLLGELDQVAHFRLPFCSLLFALTILPCEGRFVMSLLDGETENHCNRIDLARMRRSTLRRYKGEAELAACAAAGASMTSRAMRSRWKVASPNAVSLDLARR